MEKMEYRLTKDWVFRIVYGSDTDESREALRAFLNVVLDRKDGPIEKVMVLNPVVPNELESLKEIVMDIKAETDKGELINIEMQAYGLAEYPDSALFNGARLIGTSLEKGSKYGRIRPSIVISVIKGVIFPNISKSHPVFTVNEIDEGEGMSDKITWHYLELGKLEDKLDLDTASEYENVIQRSSDCTSDSAVKRPV